VTDGQKHYLARETLIGAIVNALISAAFACAVFKGDPARVWGSPSLALDFLPQSFAVAAFSVLVPTLLTRKRMRAGAVVPLESPAVRLPRSVLVRALLIGAAATVLLGGSAIGLTTALVRGPVPFAAVLCLKIGHGAAVGALVTWVALRQALADRPSARA
jgi:hypothetical protein